MEIDASAFARNIYRCIAKHRKTPAANEIMAGSMVVLAALWIALQTLHIFGHGYVIGGYELSVDFHDRSTGLNGIPDAVIIDTAESSRVAALPKISGEDANVSVYFATGVVGRMRRLEENLIGAGVLLRENSPSRGQYIFSSPGGDALEIGAKALVASKASTYLLQFRCENYGLSEDVCARYISTYKLNGTSLADACTLVKIVDCSEISIYRTIDGSCNNADNPSWGSALTAYSRLLFPNYSDGIQEPKKAERRGRALPGPRIVSTTLSSRNADISDVTRTLSVMQWTQFVAHDLAHTPVRNMVATQQPISCCDSNGVWPLPRYIHPYCDAIHLPEQDPIYGSLDVDCMNYVRSLPAMRPDCNFGPIEQMNQASHFLDGSTIYGSTPQRARELRSFANGELRVEKRENGDYLPNPPADASGQCRSNGICYKTGDDRANSEPSLAVMHTLWHREHNRLAKRLAKLNPHWTDEILYQESRRIVIAEIQRVTYEEWLPNVLGKDYTEAIGLGTKRRRTRGYDSHEDPSVFNEVATAVFQFLNSMKQGRLSLPDEQRRTNASLRLSEYFFAPRVIENGAIFDGLIRGLATQTSNKMDINLIPDITHRLYGRNGTLGLDAISLDIQRGRDHGLPGYNRYRGYCGISLAKKFSDFSQQIPRETIKKLETLYDRPGDVDLIIGGMVERPTDESLLGPTFRCLLSEQMARVRRTDRYFYDSADQPHPFTRDQLYQLQRVTLARIYCDNSNNVSSMQPNVFVRPQAGNDLVSCDNFQVIPSVGLRAWADKAKAYR